MNLVSAARVFLARACDAIGVHWGSAHEQDAAQAIFCHKKCLRDQVSKSVPLLTPILD